MLRILFEDKNLLAVSKPAGFLVHKTAIAKTVTENLVETLQQQLNRSVFPIHRIDRPTSGIVWFAFNRETANTMRQLWVNQEVKKYYVALLRGFCPLAGHITKALCSEYDKKEKEAITYYQLIQHIELPIAQKKFPTTRYSLVLCMPITGRTHQLRKHFAHIRHYIIGDKKHGDTQQNKHAQINFNLNNMLLHAFQTQFTHPVSGKAIIVNDSLPKYWRQILTEETVDQKLRLSLSQLSVASLLPVSQTKECTHYVYS